MITLIEGNISLQYGANIWQAAVLNVDSGLADGGNTDFVKVSTAVQKYKKSILPPDINESKLGFYPQNDKIVYGIKPVTSINYEDAKFIIENRPYSSLIDFHNKCVVNGILTERKTINLIKAGMFDSFDNRRNNMINYISHIVPECTRVSKVSTKKLYNYIPEHLKSQALLYLTFNENKKKKLNEQQILQLCDLFNQFNINIIDYYDGEKLKEKELKKLIDKNTQKLSDWFKTNEAKQAKTKFDRNEMWQKHCLGSKEKWEFDALQTYLGNTEFKNMNFPESFNIKTANELPEEPNIIGKTQRGFNIYEEVMIAGTVIDKNANKKRVTIITDDGLLDCRINNFKHYNNKTKEDPSWFEKGTNLILIGYKRGANFYTSHRNHVVNHSVVKIIGRDRNNNAILKYEKD